MRQAEPTPGETRAFTVIAWGILSWTVYWLWIAEPAERPSVRAVGCYEDRQVLVWHSDPYWGADDGEWKCEDVE